MPPAQEAKAYSFHLKIHMDIALSLEWSGQKLVAPSLPFSCL